MDMMSDSANKVARWMIYGALAGLAAGALELWAALS
jgi:hypothetical protein